LPGLILALDKRHGRISRVMLGAADWNASRPGRLRAGEAGRHVVRLGWFASMPAGLLTAISASGQRTDLVTIPFDTSEQNAAAAMRQAARAGNREHAPRHPRRHYRSGRPGGRHHDPGLRMAAAALTEAAGRAGHPRRSRHRA
jgi:hypothetical protein